MKDYLSVTETADFLKLSDGRVRKLLKAGLLRGEKCGKQWIIRISEADRFKALERPPGNPILRQPAQVG